ncbi:MAG TPA: hypothetical protein VJ846_01825 [Sphingomicrobium sp.]|nr:hypothetical protein [Sphingomicrobium sp.]
MRALHAAFAIAASASLAIATPAESKGCIRGAIAGGVVGHVAGHHALAGAAAGCVAGHMYYKHKARQEHRAAMPPRHHH